MNNLSIRLMNRRHGRLLILFQNNMNVSANLFIPRRNSNSLCPSGMLKTLITVPCRGESGQTRNSRKKGGIKKWMKSSPSLKRWPVWCQRHWRWGLPGDCHGLGSTSRCSKGANKCFLMTSAQTLVLSLVGFSRDCNLSFVAMLEFTEASPGCWHRRPWSLR